MTLIYTLSDSRDVHAIRYVGLTSRTLQYRRTEHLYEASVGTDSHRHNWIRKVLRDGGEIVATVLMDDLSWTDALDFEIFYIKFYRDCGYRLTNRTDGGEGALGYIHTAESKEKMSLAAQNMSDEHKAKMSASSTGRKHTDKTKAKMSASRLGVRKSDHHRAAMSVVARNRTAEHRRNNGASKTRNHLANLALNQGNKNEPIL